MATTKSPLRQTLPQVDAPHIRIARCAALLATLRPAIGPISGAGALSGWRITVETAWGPVWLVIEQSCSAIGAAVSIEPATVRNATATLILCRLLEGVIPLDILRSLRARLDPEPQTLRVVTQLTVNRVTIGVEDAAATVVEACESWATEGAIVFDNARFLRLRGAAVLGAPRIPSRTLAAMRPGDVVLLGRPAAASGGLISGTVDLCWGHIHWPHIRAKATIQEKELTLTTAPNVESDASFSTPADATAKPLASEQRMDVSRLELPVIAALEVKAMSIAEIALLRPGQTLQLASRVDSAHVTLSVQGVPFAVGELVAVGGQLGVQVTRFHSVPVAVPREHQA